LIIIIAGIIGYVIKPMIYTIPFLTNVIANYHMISIIFYFLLLVVQGITFIPLPTVFVGIILFNAIEVFIVNLLSVLTSAIIIYYFSEYIGSATYFEKNYSKYINQMKKALKHREFIIIMLWSFLPFTPTNAVVYVSSTLRINIFKCLFGVLIGEAVVNAFYIFVIKTAIKSVIG
jgi:uncharacterized membrane protein YdjX (TVP38/TMEM64 family)